VGLIIPEDYLIAVYGCSLPGFFSVSEEEELLPWAEQPQKTISAVYGRSLRGFFPVNGSVVR
jgi:hypothetical protein